MRANFGEHFKLTIFGESHGPAIGVVIDGLPAGEALDLSVLQQFLARRAPGQNRMTTARKEPDLPQILSGVLAGKTTGAPLCAVIQNTDTHASLKAYLGRTGQKAGFSSEDRIKVAQISLPFDAAVGEVTATVSNALCAGVVQTASDAVKGCVNIPLQPIRYVLRECSILSFDQSKVTLLSAQNRRAVIFYASYDAEGRLVRTHIQTIDLKQGENELSLDGIDFGPFETLSVMVWDSTGSLRPLTDKATIQYQK